MPGNLYSGYDPFNIDSFYNGIVALNKSTSSNITGTCPQTDMRGCVYAQTCIANTTRFGFQKFIDITGANIYERYCWSGSWTPWCKLQVQ